MNLEAWSLIVQTGAVVVAVFAVLAALRIAHDDRRVADARAERDRAAARAQAERRWELDILVRLSQNMEHGGSTDALERNRLAAEMGALLSALGPNRLPLSWQTYRKDTLENARAYMEDPSNAAWRRCANEVLLELDRVARDGRRTECAAPA